MINCQGVVGLSMSLSVPHADGAGRRWGHYGPQLLAGSILAIIALSFRPYAVGAVTLSMAAALLVFVILTWIKMRQHDRGLCERCMTSMPLNATEHAARFQRRFWLAHSGSRPRYLVPYMALLIATNFLTSTPGRVLWAVVQASMIYLIVSYSTHRKLQPWCPWCSEGGGGSEQFDLDPDLPRGDDRQLV